MLLPIGASAPISSWNTLSGILIALSNISPINKLLIFNEKVCLVSGSFEVAAISWGTSDFAKLIPSGCIVDMLSSINFFDSPVSPPLSLISDSSFAAAERGESLLETEFIKVNDPESIL